MLGIKRSGTRGKLLLEKRERFPLKIIHEPSRTEMGCHFETDPA
ncbi:hypothetical protein PI125_g11654 [Phytophthora idaei]|nr:hypothetical protein PI125_g11654 [Phytophthora idaei]